MRDERMIITMTSTANEDDSFVHCSLLSHEDFLKEVIEGGGSSLLVVLDQHHYSSSSSTSSTRSSTGCAHVIRNHQTDEVMVDADIAICFLLLVPMLWFFFPAP